MTESFKTFTFVGVGVAAIVVALVTRPKSANLDVESLRGELLTRDFTTPSDAKRLKIVRFDEDSAAIRRFEVAEVNGLWTLPSKENYPADAARQMAEAATALIDRKILEVTSTSPSDHVQFGVVDPDGPNLEVGQKGVGTRVTVTGVQDKVLVDLIIGKEVKELPGKRFVRKAGQDIVYIIEVDPSRLSTKFEDWIEKDLLKFSTFDLRQVQIKDYSAEVRIGVSQTGRPELIPTWDPRAEMTLALDDGGTTWSPVKLRAFQPQANDYVEFTLAEDEELNTTALNDLKNALADLQIVDVARKPVGLSQDLKAGEDFLNNPEALKDLVARGFTPAQVAEGGARDIISNDGEVIATMKNGTEYVLRFGNLVQVDDESSADDAAKAEGAKSSADKAGIHRYLFVMARFNEAAVNKPELAELPALPQGAQGAETPNDDKSAAGTESTPAAGGSGDDAGEPPAPFVTQDEKSETTTDAQQEGKQSSESKQDAPATSGAETPQSQSDAKQTETADQGAEVDAELAKIIAERKQLEAENQRKLDEYQNLLKEGRDEVKDLNLRFGDWYFVIGNDVFTKIRLGRDQVVKKKEAKSDDGKADDASAAGAPGDPLPGLISLPADEKIDEKKTEGDDKQSPAESKD